MTLGNGHQATDPDLDRRTDAVGRDRRLALCAVECLQPLGRFSVRRLGRWYGLFHLGGAPDAPVGIVYCNELYLKAGPDAVTRYIACGMRPFRPGPRQPLRGYWRVPPEVLDEPEALCAWAAAAVDAARRFGKRRRPRRRKRRPGSR